MNVENAIEEIKPTPKYIAGPFTSNRKVLRTFLSRNAARNKKRKAATYGYRAVEYKAYPDAVVSPKK